MYNLHARSFSLKNFPQARDFKANFELVSELDERINFPLYVQVYVCLIADLNSLRGLEELFDLVRSSA